MNCVLGSVGILLFLLLPLASQAQDRSGELRLSVTDSSGAALPAHGVLLSQASHFELSFDPTGEYTVKKLPLGNYKLSLEHPGFALYSSLIEIRSELPLKFSAALAVAAVTQSVNVQDTDTLLDVTNVGNSYQLGATVLRDWAATVPGRQAIEVVQAQPGWLLEANGVLHPRGSEYDTQFVADGLPILNNRSPAFSPSEDLDDVQTVKTYTSGIPAEFGRKVGGVVETVTDRNPAHGVHGSAILGGGSFDTENGFLGTSYYDGRNLFGLSMNAGRTDRFLDSPATENFTNRATIAGAKGSFERDLTQKDRLRLALSFDRAGFMVPNELIQQGTRPGEAQRQDRNNREVLWSGRLSAHLLIQRARYTAGARPGLGSGTDLQFVLHARRSASGRRLSRRLFQCHHCRSFQAPRDQGRRRCNLQLRSRTIFLPHYRDRN